MATLVSTVTITLVLGPLNPFEGELDQAFFRLLVGSSMLIGNALLFMILESRYHGIKLLGLVLLAYIGSAQLLGHVETIAFNFMFNFGTKELSYLFYSQALTAAVLVPLIITIAGKWKAPAVIMDDRTGQLFPDSRTALILRVLILAVLWYFCYMLAGYFIADPITHDYYLAKNPALNDINTWLPILQFFRGIGWTLLFILGIRIMNRPLRESGLLIGLAFGIFHSAGLLLPNPSMPTEMRLSHFPEIVISLVFMGSLVVSVMGFRPKGAAGIQS